MFDAKVKKLKKESTINKILKPLLQESFKENIVLKQFFIDKIELSKESGLCNIFLFGGRTKEEQEMAIQEVKMLGPSTRAALARILKSRYTPEIRFLFNHNHDKIAKLDAALLQVNKELKILDESDSATNSN